MVDCAGILLMSTSAPVAMDAPAAMVIEGGGRLFNTKRVYYHHKSDDVKDTRCLFCFYPSS